MIRHLSVEGLTAQEVESSRLLHGSNELPLPKAETFLEKLKENFEGPLIRILCIALAITMVLAAMGYASWLEGIGIALSVFIATVVATYSEFKNESSFQELQAKANKIKSKIYRQAGLQLIEIGDIVVGDKVLLQAGDKIPADGNIVAGQLLVNQASLNGEQLPVKKSPSADKHRQKSSLEEQDLMSPHRLMRGSVVEEGEAVLEVDAVGSRSVYGRMAVELSATPERDAPLQVKLTQLADGIARLGYMGATAVAVSFMFKQIVMDNRYSWSRIALYFGNWQIALHDVVTSVILGIIVIVVAVPEGLPTMIAIVLSLNMRKLLRDQVLVRRLIGIETAGCLDILFADKTGTLTEGVFKPETFVCGDGSSYSSYGSIPRALRWILAFTVRESASATYVGRVGNENAKAVGGNSTDQALLSYLGADGQVREDFRVVPENEILFSSAHKYSATQIKIIGRDKATDLPVSWQSLDSFPCPDGLGLTLLKGAAEVVLAHCSHYYMPSGERAPLGSGSQMESMVRDMSCRGSRVLALATSSRPIPRTDKVSSDGSGGASAPVGSMAPELSGNLTLVGVIGVADRIRSSSKACVDLARNAGIQVIMITGDRKETAVAVAQEIGLLTANEEKQAVMTSDELASLSMDDLRRILPGLRVVARALPSDKSRLVHAAQNADIPGCTRVVGMTGDGVNDSAALKAADVSFAMGSGAEVAKEAADVVILDDNFQSIMQAVLYGRTIFKSIRKFIVNQSTINLASGLIVFLGPFLGFDFPLTLIQLLWLNLVMDTLAAIAFGGEPPLNNYMNEPPVQREAPIIDRLMWSSILWNGLAMALYSIVFLTWDGVHDLFDRHTDFVHLPGGEVEAAAHESVKEIKRQGGPVFLTAFFSFFIFLCGFNAVNVRTHSTNLLHHVTANRGFVVVIPLIFLIQISFTYVGGSVLRTVPLYSEEWLTLIAMASVLVPLDMLRKYLVAKYYPAWVHPTTVWRSVLSAHFSDSHVEIEVKKRSHLYTRG